VHGYGCERGTKLEGLVKVPDKKKRQIDNQNSTNSSSKKATKASLPTMEDCGITK
jgi:hypothetical protein